MKSIIQHLCLSALLFAFAGIASAHEGHEHAPAAPATAMKKMSRPVALGTSFAYAQDGSLIAVGLHEGKLALWRSVDQGKSFSAPQLIGNDEAAVADGEQRPRLLVLNDGAWLLSYNRPMTQKYSGEVRATRSDDQGKTWSTPITVHSDKQDLSHRFETLVQDGAGDVWAMWIDRRNDKVAQPDGKPYKAAAIYAARSRDGGKSFEPDFKLADHSCECCRIAAIPQPQGVLALWRHVFYGGIRDHALVSIDSAAPAKQVNRATFDNWKVDACPHHGPALAVTKDGVRHYTWFGIRDGESAVRYAQMDVQGKLLRDTPIDDAQASHADIGITGSRIAIAWKSFDGVRVTLKLMSSKDGGATFNTQQLSQATATGSGDQPRVLTRGDALQVAWRTSEGMEVFDVR